MAFLNFIFKDKQGDDALEQASSAPAVEEVEGTAVAEEVAPASGILPLPDVPGERLGDADEMDLDQLIEALQLISDFLDEGEPGDDEGSPEATPADAVSIPFTLEQVSDLLNEAFDQQAVAKADTSKMMKVSIVDVFSQLGCGRVTTQVKHLLADVPVELLKKGFDRFSEDDVSLPLALVVSAVQPAELESRTADEKTAPDLDSMPDLFASGPSASPAEAEEAVSEPVAPEPRFDDMADPFSLATPAAAEEKSVEPEPIADQEPEAGTLKFELNENADIFNFSASPVNEACSDAEIAPPSVELVVDPVEEPDEEPVAEAPVEELVEESIDEHIEPETAVEVIDLEPAFEETAEPAAAEQAMPETPPPEASDEIEEPEVTDIPGEVFGPAVIGDNILAGGIPATEEEAPVASEAGQVLLSGLDLNQADAQQMSNRWDGVGPRLADRIVRHREINGPFRSKADLARVRGVGPSTYRKMTGLSWSEARDSLMRTLDYVLGAEAQDVPDLKAMARRIHSLTGFEGCVFVHSDGHMLAASWDDDKQEVLGAVAPQILKKLSPYVDELDIGDLNPLTLCLGDTSICFAQSGNLIMATVHRGTGLGRRQTRLIELLGSELEQRFEVTMDL